MLMPYADFLATIDNSRHLPRLQYFAAIDRSGSFKRITARFAHTLPGTDGGRNYDPFLPFRKLR